jgi:hypothetical protein
LEDTLTPFKSMGGHLADLDKKGRGGVAEVVMGFGAKAFGGTASMPRRASTHPATDLLIVPP